ncbi:MAG: hypothetical protein RTV41_01665 [Candidatus Thorarchaeota archaeon]
MSKKKDDSESENLLVIGRLLAFFITKDMEKQKDKITTLGRLGLSNKEIATILGIHSGTVSKALS